MQQKTTAKPSRAAKHPAAPPPRLSAGARRNQLIEVACDLFSRKGFAGTTTREIALAAGVTEAIIFRHFTTKEQLYKAIIDRALHAPGMAEWMAGLRGAMEKNEDETVVRQLITAIVSMHKNNPKFERLVLYAALEGNHVALLHMRQITAGFVDAFTNYFERRQKEGALSAIGAEIALVGIVGMAKHYAQCRYIHPLGEITMSDEQAIENFTAMALHGIRRSFERTSSSGRKR